MSRVALECGDVGPELAIGAVASAFTDVLPTALRRYRTVRPNVQLRLIEVDTEASARAGQVQPAEGRPRGDWLHDIVGTCLGT